MVIFNYTSMRLKTNMRVNVKDKNYLMPKLIELYSLGEGDGVLKNRYIIRLIVGGHNN